MSETTPLEVTDLRKRYQVPQAAPVEAVAGIGFRIGAGECFGLLGPNGAGKSTAMRCITGFYPASSGTVLIEGTDVHRQPKRARRRLGVCEQEDTLDTDYTAFEQLVRYASFFHIPRREARRRAERLLARFGLSDKAGRPVEALSGGMRRRLQVARALIGQPRLLVLDEPTTGLDPEARRTLWDVLAEYRRQGLAILLSTHYMDEAERLCDRVAIISHGRLLDCRPPGELVAAHVGAASVREEVRPGVLWERAPNLEDVYLKLTGLALEASADASTHQS